VSKSFLSVFFAIFARMNKAIFALCAFLFSIFTLQATAKDWNADNIPMVHLQDARRYVCDPENIMSAAMRDSTDVYIGRLEKEAGIQAVFVIVSHVENGDPFRVAQDIGNKYGVGNKKTDRGLVIVVAVDDRKYFIAPGDGLEGDLTDVECDDIARICIVKNMRKGNPDMAMLSTAKAIYNKFKTGETGIESPKEGADDAIAAAIILSVVFFWIIWSIRNRGNNGRGGGRRGGSSTNSIFWGNPGHMNDRHFGGGFGGGSFGGGSFGGGGSGGGW
jgi:Beta-propeller domains of methanol dehydrogenase type